LIELSADSFLKRAYGWLQEGIGGEIVEFFKKLKEENERKIDLIVDFGQVRAVLDEKDVRLRIPLYGDYPLTDWAHEQLAEKLGIPKRYYSRMREEKPDLLLQNINAWLCEMAGERKFVRILNGRIRAILSDRYRVIDNYDVLLVALQEFRRIGSVEIYRIDLTEKMMYLKALDRTLKAEIRQDDIVCGGIIIRNSEVGAGAFRVEPFILRLVCENGLIVKQVLRRIHLGRQMDEGLWSRETMELEDRVLFLKVRDVIRATFDRQVFKRWVSKLKESTEIEIENPVETAKNVAKLTGLTEEQEKELLAYFTEHTKYGLINAITTLAREMKNVDERIKLEEFGGRILEGEVI